MRYRDDIEALYHILGMERHVPFFGIVEREVSTMPVRHYYGSDEVTPSLAPAGGKDLMEWYKLRRKDNRRDKVRRPPFDTGLEMIHVSS